MLDAIVAGAGPAGSIAALVMARAGARVLVVDRATFPRDKLCGDTINPGALRLLDDLGVAGGPVAAARRLGGMRVTGPSTGVYSPYGAGNAAVAIRRRDLDGWLLDAAVAAGARFEPGATVQGPLVDESTGQVRGVVLRSAGGPGVRMPASIVIGADGRRSALARGAGLRAAAPRVRRWAYGTYATGVDGMSDVGEMHIRGGSYFGLAPLDNGVVNVCAVTTPGPGARAPIDIVRGAIARDAQLTARFERATFVGPTQVLGPLAADVRNVGVPGLLLAGDAAGFVDPMTGDGIHLAMQGARLAAAEALRAIDTGDFRAAVDRLARARARAFGRKLRFNRVLRLIVDAPALVDLANLGARAAPGLLHRAVAYAGDVR